MRLALLGNHALDHFFAPRNAMRNSKFSQGTEDKFGEKTRLESCRIRRKIDVVRRNKGHFGRDKHVFDKFNKRHTSINAALGVFKPTHAVFWEVHRS